MKVTPYTSTNSSNVSTRASSPHTCAHLFEPSPIKSLAQYEADFQDAMLENFGTILDAAETNTTSKQFNAAINEFFRIASSYRNKPQFECGDQKQRINNVNIWVNKTIEEVLSALKDNEHLAHLVDNYEVVFNVKRDKYGV